MFERNRADTIEQQGVAVEITTDHGETLAGKIIVGPGRSLSQLLNSESAFIEFEPWGGERTHLAKALLRSVKPARVARPESLMARINAIDGFDPYTVLGVRSTSSLDEAKHAWRRLSMAYHPDRYAMAELPDEVTAYLAAMARRVNAAYATLESTLSKRKPAPAREAPLYTPPVR